MSILIKGGNIVNSDRKFTADILLEKSQIKQIGTNILPTNPDVHIIDASNKLILPGPIDGLTNFMFQDGCENQLLNETEAALSGGNTMIISTISKDDISKMMNKNVRSMCNYGFVVEICSDDAGAPSFMEECVKSYGVNCFQLLISEPITKTLPTILTKASDLGCSIRIKFKNDSLVDLINETLKANGTGPETLTLSQSKEMELSCLLRYLSIMKHWPHVAICPSIASGSAADLIGQYKAQGYPILGEVDTAHLGLDGSKYYSQIWDEAASIVTNPPILVNEADKITKQLANSTMNNVGCVDLVSSHHKTVTTAQRLAGQSDFRNITKGCIGTEERLAVLWHKTVATGLLSECDFVNLISTNVAKLYNIYPSRGHLAVGSLGDLIIWDPRGANSRVGTSSMLTNVDDKLLYNGLKDVRGRVDLVLVNGEIKWENQACVGAANGARIGLRAGNPFIVERIKRWRLQSAMENKKIERDPSSVKVDDICGDLPKPTEDKRPANAAEDAKKDSSKTNEQGLSYNRPPTSGGTRNMQDSSFSLTGTQIDDNRPNKSSIRTNQPPGGKSSIFW